MQFNHGVSYAGFWPANQDWGYGGLGHGLLVFVLFVIFFSDGLWHSLFLLFPTLLAFCAGCLDRSGDFFLFRLWLQVSQLFLIAIEIEQLRNSVRLAERGVDIHMAVTASSCEILVPQFAQGDDLNDGLGVSPRLNRELVASRLTKDDHVTFALSTDKKFAFLASDLHRVEWLVRFNCVRDTLGELVPDLERIVETGGDELVVIHAHQTCDFVIMRSG